MEDKNNRHIELEARYGANNYSPLPVMVCRAEGVYIWDEDDRRYMDMLSAYSALSHGHRHPRIIKALVKQCESLTLTSRAFHNNRLGEFLEKLCNLTGFERALPMNTGAEAVETALKAMRKWAYEVKGVKPDSARIIAVTNNFHGRTLGVISLSSSKKSTGNFGPLLPCMDIVPFNDAHAIEQAITPDTAGVLIEPIQGEGGVVLPSDGYLPAVRETCSRNNVLLCLDEIQTGLARTGEMFCFEHYGIRPDLLTLGKSLGGGVYPVSALCTNSEVMDVFTPGTHGSTFGGNPLAAAVACAAIDVLVDEDLAANAARLGDYFMNRLREMDIPKINEIRGRGLLIGIEFNEPTAHESALKLLKNGLLAKDTRPAVLRFAPPLVITKDQIDDALRIIESTFCC